MKLKSIAALTFAWSSLFLAATGIAQQTPIQTNTRTLIISSPTLKAGEPVPTIHTPDGRNESPALRWNSVAEAKSFAVLCEDPDVGNPPPFVHWIVYNIPGTATALPAALPIDNSMPSELQGAVQGLSGFRRAIYRGPAPPPGKVHQYHFIVYALDTTITIDSAQPPLTRAQLLEAMQGHVVGKGELIATYERRK
jgi:Raf kinase inhibitor-like YbhB/YbcL family protein